MRKFLSTFPYLFERTWPNYSRLFLVGDNANWSISEDLKALAQIARKLHIQLGDLRRINAVKKQVAFYCNRYSAIPVIKEQIPFNRIGFPYFHGLPGTGYPEFDEFFQDISRFHERISRIQVTNTQIHEKILETGIAPQKVFRIPIGINISDFPLQSTISCQESRRQLKIPHSAFVIGSFQKDGNGWKQGLEPKLIKGPDLFLKVISNLKKKIPELFILLTGPSRGFVKKGLESLNVPYRHLYLDKYIEISRCYQALNLYLVTSRQEGGPKAILESMASGIPLVTTRVGQAIDLVVHEKTGWMVDVDDVEGLVYWSEYIYQRQASFGDNLQNSRQTAEANAYQNQLLIWKEFMQGFVES